MPVVNKISCPNCGQSMNPYKVAVVGPMAHSLWRVWKYCQEKQTNKVTRKQIKHLLLTDVEAARFGDWRHFGLLDKPKKGEYKLRMEYVTKFFQGKVVIPKYAWKDRKTKKVTWPTDRRDFVSVLEIPKLGSMLDEFREYIVEYQAQSQPQKTQLDIYGDMK